MLLCAVSPLNVPWSNYSPNTNPSTIGKLTNCPPALRRGVTPNYLLVVSPPHIDTWPQFNYQSSSTCISFLFFYFLLIFLLQDSIIHLLSFLLRNCSIHTNKKWNYGHVSVIPFIFVRCSLTIILFYCQAQSKSSSQPISN